jgi:MFS family permease
LLRLLGNRRISGLAGAGFLAEAGDWMLLIALPLYVLELTGSPLVTATVFVLGLAPTIVAGPLAGVLVDRSEPWKLMAVIAGLQALFLAPLVAVNDTSDLWILYSVVVIESVLGTIIEPCRATTAAGLVPPAQLAEMNQLMGVLSSLSRLLGSPLGGLILAVGGFDAIIYANAGTFLAASIIFTIGARGQKPARKDQTPDSSTIPSASPWADLVEGLQITATTPALRQVMGVVSFIALAQGGFVLLFVLFVTRELQGNEADVGVLRGVQAIGALAGGVLLGLVINRISPRQLISGSLVLFSALSLTIWNLPALTTNFPVYVILFILVGVPGVSLMTGLLTVLQSNCAPRARGRVLSTYFALFGAMQAIGTLLAGLLGTGTGMTIGLQVQGTLYLIAALMALRLRTPEPT